MTQSDSLTWGNENSVDESGESSIYLPSERRNTYKTAALSEQSLLSGSITNFDGRNDRCDTEINSLKDSQIIRTKSATSKSQKPLDNKRCMVLPLFRVPTDGAGIMWTGNFRRKPVLIFSQKCITNKSESTEKLGRSFNLSFRLLRAECKLLRTILQSHGLQESTTQLGNFNLLWTGCHIRPNQMRLMAGFNKVNHFPRSYELTRKDRLAKNVQRMQKLKGTRHFDFLPKTYILQDEFRDLCAGYLHDKGPYIVKPIASSRGRGIYIVSHPEEIPYDEPVIVSRYISSPLLLDGFKFDVRIYAAVTSYDPLVVYIYEEGLVRFATVRYQPGMRNLKTQCMHLTNYSVNKKNFEFVQNDDANVEDFGNKWSLGALLRYLKSIGADITGLMLRIEDIIIKSFLCVVGPIASACSMFQPCKSQCFELYGFDIIVDRDFRPWLLEVNLSPSLACDSPLDFKVKSNMLTDLFSLVGLVCHDPSRKTQGGVNSLHMTAAGDAALPPPPPTHYMSADDYMELMHNKNPKDAAKTWLSSLCVTPQSSQSDSNGFGLTGTTVSHLLPDGMTGDEVKFMRRLQEEASRAGGWLRLIPNSEVWEQYANIWPNDSNNMSMYNARRTEANVHSMGSFNPVVSGYERHTQSSRPTGMNSLIASAYSAAFAAWALNEIEQQIRNEQNKNHPGRTRDRKPMSSRLADDEPNTSQSSKHDRPHLHPNSASIPVSLTTYLLRTDRELRQTKIEHRIEPTSVNRVPNATAVARTQLPIHNLSQSHMAQCLRSLFLPVRTTSLTEQQCQRILACYNQTLVRMPFFLRKLGESPVQLPGVHLCPWLHQRPSTAPVVDRREGSQASLSRTMMTGGDTSPIPHETESLGKSSSPTDFPCPIRPISASSTPIKPRISTHESQDRVSVSGTMELVSASQLSASQARHVFAAYLSRLQSRLLLESRETRTKTPISRLTLRRENKQVDMMAHFLRRASNSLSPQAIEMVCSKDLMRNAVHASISADKLLPSTFPVHIPDRSHPLSERKRALARLLDKFVRIYQYETVAISTPGSTAETLNSMTATEVSSFWQFIREATEKQLEEILGNYTQLHRSVDVFMGYKCEYSAQSSSRGNSISSHKAKNTTTIPNGVSTDSGFGSSIESSFTPERRSSIPEPRGQSVEVGTSYSPDPPVSQPSNKRESRPPIRLLSWTTCCLPSRPNSSANKALSRKSVSDTLEKYAPYILNDRTEFTLSNEVNHGKQNTTACCSKPTSSKKSTSSARKSRSKHVTQQTDNFLAGLAGRGVLADSSCQTSGPDVRLRLVNRKRIRNRPARGTNQPVAHRASMVYSTRCPSTPHIPRDKGPMLGFTKKPAVRRMIPICRIRADRPPIVSTLTRPMYNHNALPSHIDSRINEPRPHCSCAIHPSSSRNELHSMQGCDSCNPVSPTNSANPSSYRPNYSASSYTTPTQSHLCGYLSQPDLLFAGQLNDNMNNTTPSLSRRVGHSQSLRRVHPVVEM